MTDASDITERGQAIDWVESTLESNAHYEHASPFLHDFVEKVVKGIQKPEDDANTLQQIFEKLDDPAVSAEEIALGGDLALLMEALDNDGMNQIINEALTLGVETYRTYQKGA